MKKTNKTKIGYFIISHGRPNEQLTYKLLCSDGVEIDDIFIVCDDLDTTLPEYIQNYGDRVIVFDKQRYMDSCDSGVQSPTGLHAVYARNAAYDLALEKGYDFFVIADDDIDSITYRYPDGDKLRSKNVHDVKNCFIALSEYMQTSDKIYCIGIAPHIAFMGGVKAPIVSEGMKRVVFNIGLYRAGKRIRYASECQEDLAASILYNQQGKLMFSCGLLQQSAIVEGRNKEGGGIEGHYDKSNDYYRHFGTLIYVPATIAMRLDSDTFTKKYMSNYYPMILSDRWKK